MKIRQFISISLLSAALLSPAAAYADGKVTGVVTNRSNGDSIDFATVQLVDAKTGNPLPIGTMTDGDGRFSIPDVKKGKYLVRVSSLGWEERDVPLTVGDGNVEMGTIDLKNDTKMLEEVVVEGVKSQMRFELDRKVFQVDANVAAAGASASELLSSIPSVEVDQDGEVSLRGNSSVTVWINGKESGLTADNRAQILEQIPAETIERIEVITNPSAKYSPEGTAGIINIVLKADRKAGYFGSAELGANTRGGGNAGVSVNYNSPKWEAYGSVGYRLRCNTGGSLSERTYTDDPSLYLNSNGTSKNRGQNVFLRAGVTYHPTQKDAVGLNAFGMLGKGKDHGTTSYYSNLPDQWISDIQKSNSTRKMRGAHAELTYQHKWGETQILDALVGYNHWGGPSTNVYSDTKDYGGWDLDNYKPVSDIKSQDQNISSNGIEAKLDYSQTFSNYLKLETGYNGNYGHENTPVFTDRGTSEADMQFYPQLFNRFIYTNNVSALYLTLGGNAGNLSYSAGVRSESWQVRGRSLEWDMAADREQTKAEASYDVNKNFFALFPSAFVSYRLPHDNEVQINYTRRLRRPWGGQLNSWHDISNPTNISYGNPELEPQYTNAFELNYIKSFTWHMLSLSAYMRTSSNCMNRLSYMGAENVLYTTWVNVGDEVNSGAEIVAKNNLFKILDLTTTVNLYNNHIKGWNYTFHTSAGDYAVSNKSRSSFAWDARMMANFKLPWQLAFQATGNYRSKSLTAQGSRQGGWSVDAGLRKTVGNWSFSLNCRDIFDSRKWKSTTESEDYRQYNERWRGGRNLSLTVKYAFGNMKAKRSKADDAVDDNSGYSGEF